MQPLRRVVLPVDASISGDESQVPIRYSQIPWQLRYPRPTEPLLRSCLWCVGWRPGEWRAMLSGLSRLVFSTIFDSFIIEKFKLVQNIIAKYGIDLTDIWNFDETGFMMGIIASGMVVTGSERLGRPKSVQLGSREWITVIQAINAEGWAIEPFIIGAGQYHLGKAHCFRVVLIGLHDAKSVKSHRQTNSTNPITCPLPFGLLSHFEKAKIHYSTPEFHDSRMLHSIEMGWFVLNKYYTMSEEAPVYVAALLLDPRCRKAYLDKNWKSAWINPAIAGVRQVWEEEYNINNSVNDIDGDIVTTPEDTPVAPGKPPSQLQLLLQEMEVETAVSTDSDNLEAFINAPAIKIDCEPLEWWCRTEQRRQFPRLSRMAIDILSINPQSAEPERTFSGARRTASWDRLSITCERIEEVECLGNWIRNGHIVASRDGGLGLVCDPDGVNGNVDTEISDTE
ncbi:hypothetical protein FPOA_12540 [Fusarium poae]|uniref:HAT C-terminal dimerisation domain-containing protein n=1 Tax=Fusarium poae TaxID=36050 RepID=A0A1B8A8V1_FUSPO|nr:hypothetical protein FPOA_12540 [Fusarium poae]